MKEIKTSAELKEVQMGILMAIHEFCEAHRIRYSLAAGTLIGAIRHKGYIPWDDDIDIYLPRQDYERLIKEFPATYGHYALNSLERNPRWNRPYAKAYDTRTIEEEEVANNVEGTGVGIDVFVIDEVPDDDRRWQSFRRKRKLLINIYMLKALKWRKERSLLKNLSVLGAKVLLWPFSYRWLARRIDKYIQQFTGEGNTSVFESCWALAATNRFSKDDFSDTVDVEFEQHRLKAMKGYDHYLRAFYGDYMQLPPEDQRITHHTFKAYWK